MISLFLSLSKYVPITGLSQDNPLQTWRLHVQEFLEELLRYDGRGDWVQSTDRCPSCNLMRPTVIRCEDCYGRLVVCEECAKVSHMAHPFHRIKVCSLLFLTSFVLTMHAFQRWNGRYFAAETLQSIGVFVQLGPHAPGRRCPTSSNVLNFVVLHTNGVHQVALYGCNCSGLQVPRYCQLLRAGIFPATVIDTHTGATFEALRTFHLLSLQGKVTGYDFVHALELATDNTGLVDVPVSLPFLLFH